MENSRAYVRVPPKIESEMSLYLTVLANYGGHVPLTWVLERLGEPRRSHADPCALYLPGSVPQASVIEEVNERFYAICHLTRAVVE